MRRVARILVAIPAVLFSIAWYAYLTLPDVRPLRDANPSTTAFIELRAREARRRGARPRRVQVWMPYNRISEQLKRAVLAAEDSAFWEHEGVDLEQLQKSMEINLERGTVTRGGSTITQQLAKNLFLSPSKDPMRKFRELLIARRLEAELSKRRILEIYLNVIEWGDGVYGAEAAARTYFGRSSSSLSGPDSALLAGAIINPRVYSPARPNARLRSRQRLILRRMRYVEPPPPAPVTIPPPELLDVEPIPVAPGDILPGEPLPSRPLPPVRPIPREPPPADR
ncbi:MAG TPA: monofunctional biosynthetic peptidoglycan transglycosylase [Vicinamibacterales bacterium]|nr:monofunctional biosynthetic peptidoglycan transglycosylase [Vicinamibacterales bacterium]